MAELRLTYIHATEEELQQLRHEGFAVWLLNYVLEEIRVGLELNDYGAQLKRLAYLRFLGELYNYEHVDSSVIFETL
ncbi:hypothetical protein DY000_02037493 [Brassica cretica]|uniref:MIF4G domain-containing protein n=1 Tax=Brassica cretica TaxID=69181 RepID=A0ABQ7BCV2_BRACR|nr:hypothetical protein DY000_02037493 [Brassica cretica]